MNMERERLMSVPVIPSTAEPLAAMCAQDAVRSDNAEQL